MGTRVHRWRFASCISVPSLAIAYLVSTEVNDFYKASLKSIKVSDWAVNFQFSSKAAAYGSHFSSGGKCHIMALSTKDSDDGADAKMYWPSEEQIAMYAYASQKMCNCNLTYHLFRLCLISLPIV